MHRVAGGRASDDDSAAPFSIDVRPVLNEGEQLLLIGFVDVCAAEPGLAAKRAQDIPRVAELEQELETARADLQAAIRELESSNEEQKAVNEEALSVNEEFQSTNEELLTSKEELQSLNEELTALNGHSRKPWSGNARPQTTCRTFSTAPMSPRYFSTPT